MPSGPQFRPAILAARQKMAEGRHKLRAQHDAGSPGIQVCAHLTDLLDSVLLDLYDDALEGETADVPALITLVAHGGFGRRDVAPFSDVDLMLLHRPGAERRMGNFVRRLTQSIYDVGLTLGFSMRTPHQARVLAVQDATIFTSLVEARFLAGSVQLFTRFMNRFRRTAVRRSTALIDRIERARLDERRQFGETVYLLEPNVKRSRGGLRDLQLMRWVGFARYGEAEYENLQRAGMLPAEDRRRLRRAREFLLRLRNDLHFQAGRSHDLLGKSEQLRLAERYKYPGDENVLPVERFMREYIEHTSQVRYIVAHFVSATRQPSTVWTQAGSLFSHRVGGDYRVGPWHIGATRRGLAKVRGNLEEILRLMDLSNRYNIRIDHRTWQAIRETMVDRRQLDVSPGAVQRFLSLLEQPGRLGSLLRRLHELRVLEKLIPPFAHARSLMQFNDYHKYTVDEHSIRAVECGTQFLDHGGPLGEAYRGVGDKRTLHLALLLHDLGKGFSEDHSEVGRRLAAETAARLGLPPRQTEILCFLVHQHLLMSHLAQRRNIHDDAVVAQFAFQVGSLDVLKMLYVLTCADLDAVGPGVLNRWKLDLITQLYMRTVDYLAGESAGPRQDRDQQRRRAIRAAVDRPDAWWEQQIDALPPSYLLGLEPAEIAGRLRRLRELPHDTAVAWGRYLPDRRAVEYTIGAYEEITPGIFHKLTGALTSKGLQILSAEILTLPGQLALDRFYVTDQDYAGEPPAERIDEVNAALVAALEDNSGEQPAFRRLWSPQTPGLPAGPGQLPSQVRVDNSTSQQFTILDIFAHDRRGLLYTIARTIFELGMSVHIAKIGTYLDQVVDVFYVTDQSGRKIVDERRLAEIRQRLLQALEVLETADS